MSVVYSTQGASEAYALRLCRGARLTPVPTELYAANGSPIEVAGATRLLFEVQGIPMHADVFVSPSVDEFILGHDWLVNNNCEWLFSQGRILINGVSVKLHTRKSATSVRRIFVRETVSIPPDCSANVPVRLSFVNMHTPHSDWLTEPSQIRPGLLAARTLLSDNDEYAAICLMNVSGVEHSLRGGHSLGVAMPCDVDEPPPPRLRHQ